MKKITREEFFSYLFKSKNVDKSDFNSACTKIFDDAKYLASGWKAVGFIDGQPTIAECFLNQIKIILLNTDIFDDISWKEAIVDRLTSCKYEARTSYYKRDEGGFLRFFPAIRGVFLEFYQ